MRWTVGVRTKKDRKQVTYACLEKASWTRDFEAIRWWLTEEEAYGALTAMKEKFNGKFWEPEVEWVVEDEGVVRRSLEGLDNFVF